MKYRGYQILKEWDESHTTVHFIGVRKEDGSEIVESTQEEVLREIDGIRDSEEE